MDLSTMKKWLHRFIRMDNDKDGFIKLKDFTKFLRVPNDACVQAVFNSADKVRNYYIIIAIPFLLSGKLLASKVVFKFSWANITDEYQFPWSNQQPIGLNYCNFHTSNFKDVATTLYSPSIIIMYS